MEKREAKVITLEQAGRVRTSLSLSWKRAAGLLQSKRKALTKHLASVRRDWER